MGLDFAKKVYGKLENKPRWSYGGFMRFRMRVAKSIGIDLLKMKGFESNPIGVSNCGLDWPGTDIIEPFLWHSDCDGTLSSCECEDIGPRLAEIILMWGEPKTDTDKYDYEMGKKLVNAMRECAEEDADLIFC